MQVVDALELLAAALRRAGVALWEPPKSAAAVEQLQAVLAPMRLPDELLTFWRLVDVTTLRVEPYPAFTRPEDALSFWEMDRDEFASEHPLACVEVGYQSHACMGMELDLDGVVGGALFEWFVSDLTAFIRRFNTLGDWLAHIALLVDRGFFERVDTEHGPRLLVPGPDQEKAAEAVRPVPAAHPIHGDQLVISPRRSEWPRTGSRSTAYEARGEGCRAEGSRARKRDTVDRAGAPLAWTRAHPTAERRPAALPPVRGARGAAGTHGRSVLGEEGRRGVVDTEG